MNKLKSNNKYKEITIYELNILYLDYKYNKISLKSFGLLQNKAKVINEYLGDLKVKNLDSKKVENFHNYLLKERNWKYLHGSTVSETQIANILLYLDSILQQAIFWKLLSKNPMREKVNYSKKLNKKNELHVKKTMIR